MIHILWYCDNEIYFIRKIMQACFIVGLETYNLEHFV